MEGSHPSKKNKVNFDDNQKVKHNLSYLKTLKHQLYEPN